MLWDVTPCSQVLYIYQIYADVTKKLIATVTNVEAFMYTDYRGSIFF